ncbi:MAG: hypothetical protein JSR39_05740 [Verrucomicrobia bacterium]|nr:hypothetical protein [Verrucomicrobiota bacterium]
MNAEIATTFCPQAQESVEQIGLHATALSLSEVGLGSIMHALHIPFTGTLLSLNQIFLLTRSLSQVSSRSRTFSPFSISASAALIKCLAPIGKKLTPMLAICMQGMLYNLGILCFGNTLLGRLTGGVLSSIWSFLQPLLLYWLLFGSSFFLAVENLAWMESLFYGLIVGKAIAAFLIVLFTPLLPASKFEQYFHKLSSITKSKHLSSVFRHPAKQALSDLCKPLFLASLVITVVFLYFSQGMSKILIWGIIRPLGAGFLCFFLMRVLPFELWLKRMKNGN